MSRFLGQTDSMAHKLQRVLMPSHTSKSTPVYPYKNLAKQPRKKTAAIIGSLAGLLLLPVASYAITNHADNNESAHNHNSVSNSSSQGTPINSQAANQSAAPSNSQSS